MRTLVIGIGNEYRHDDAIGLYVARALRKQLDIKPINAGATGPVGSAPLVPQVLRALRSAPSAILLSTRRPPKGRFVPPVVSRVITLAHDVESGWHEEVSNWGPPRPQSALSKGQDPLSTPTSSDLQESHTSHLEIIEHSGEGSDLVLRWSDADRVILVDAMTDAERPGTFRRFECKRDTLPPDFATCSTHNLGIAEALALGKALRTLPDHLVVYGMTGADFTMGTGLSPQVAEALDTLVQTVGDEMWSIPTKMRVG